MTDDLNREDASNFTARRATAEKLLRQGIDPYPPKVARTHSNRTVQKTYEGLATGETVEGLISVAGRVSSIRNSGMFVDIFDGTSKLQLYFDTKNGPAAATSVLADLDLGDILFGLGSNAPYQARRTDARCG